MNVPGRKSIVTTDMVLMDALSCIAYLVILVLDSVFTRELMLNS
jgi:hypothetical protein